MDPQKFEKECFEAHDACRKAHGVKPLIKDPYLTSKAQRWAEELAEKGIFKHSNEDGLGENIAYVSGKSVNGILITKMWYDEINDYDFNQHGSANGRVVGHFTQIVWQGTTKAGFGIAKEPNGKRIYACGNYAPQGNMIGKNKENVLPLEGKIDWEKLNKEKPEEEDEREVELPGGTGAPVPGTTETRRTEIVSHNGVMMKKIIITTTTVVKLPDGSLKTFTKTRWTFENISDEDKEEDEEEEEEEEKEEHDGVNILDREEIKTFRKSLRLKLNTYRIAHRSKRLKPAKWINKLAQKHAQKMLQVDKPLEYPDDRFGQSSEESSSRLKGFQVADIWYEENEDYNFDNPRADDSNKNFTQMVWKGTQNIGIGVASNEKGDSYVLALYHPKGNIEGQFKENVRP